MTMNLLDKRKQRKTRGRIKVKGSESRLRLSVFRSLKHINAQIINDDIGKTLVSVADLAIKDKLNKTKLAFEVGKLVASKAKQKKITKVRFDRRGFKYAGRIKALAEGARSGGLEF